MKLKSTVIGTIMGDIIAIADESSLYFLQFADDHKLNENIKRLEKKVGSTIVAGTCRPLIAIAKELDAYFVGELVSFQTPIKLLGTSFQNNVWRMLLKIPFGQTISYKQLAHMLENRTAFRAVAQANSKNLLPIIIPCHRIINANGNLGGYNSGLERKKWLLEHEKSTNFKHQLLLSVGPICNN